jgi:gamma-tubulin complex component 4
VRKDPSSLFSSGQVLDVYRSMILSAERAILDDPTLPLTYLVQRTADFDLLLPALLRLANEVEEHKMHGCKLLDLVSQHACSGVPIVRSCAQRILSRCFMVLYAQVSAWAVYGMLSDPHAEFCVRPAPATLKDRKGPAHEYVSASSTSAGLDNLHAAGYGDEQSYILHPEMKPNVISAMVAEKILFCGDCLISPDFVLQELH